MRHPSPALRGLFIACHPAATLRAVATHR